jgi:hypothetical protein
MKTDRPVERERRPAGVQWLLDHLLPADADSVNGDLAEAYEIRRARDGERTTDRWYRREVVVTLVHIGFSRLAQHRLAGFILLAGMAAGITSMHFGVNKPATMMAYVGLMLVVSLYLSATKAYPFWERLAASTGAFMTMTSILYVFVIVFVNPSATGMPLWGHAWRLGVMLLIGGFLGAIVALVSGDSLRARMSLFAVFLPWLSYGYWVVIRSGWGEFPAPLKVLLPYESYSLLAPSLRMYHWHVGMWLGLTVNTAVWVALALLTASLVEGRRNRPAHSVPRTAPAAKILDRTS